MNFFIFLVFVKICVAHGWCHMPFCTLLMFRPKFPWHWSLNKPEMPKKAITIDKIDVRTCFLPQPGAKSPPSVCQSLSFYC